MQQMDVEQRFRERHPFVGKVIADALPFCSLDVVGVVASYLQHGRLNDNPFTWIGSVETGLGDKADACLTIDAWGRIWVGSGRMNALRILTEDGQFIQQLHFRAPHALASSDTHVYAVAVTTSTALSGLRTHVGFIGIQSWDMHLKSSLLNDGLPCLHHPSQRVMACGADNRIYLAGNGLSVVCVIRLAVTSRV